MTELPIFSLNSLHTIGGSSLAVLLIIQMIKGLSFFKWFPTKWLTLAVSELLWVLTSSRLPTSVSEWTVLVLNGLLTASAAIGGWHIFQFTMTLPPK